MTMWSERLVRAKCPSFSFFFFRVDGKALIDLFLFCFIARNISLMDLMLFFPSPYVP